MEEDEDEGLEILGGVHEKTQPMAKKKDVYMRLRLALQEQRARRLALQVKRAWW